MTAEVGTTMLGTFYKFIIIVDVKKNEKNARGVTL
jgi:hypothetical protein